MTAPLLIEIGTEELPPVKLENLAQAFGLGIQQALQLAGLTTGSIKHYATPRRLAVRIDGVDFEQGVRKQARKGPSLQAAFDEQNKPTPAALGFAKSCGVPLDQIKIHEGNDGAWLLYESETPGKALSSILGTMIEKALEEIPAKKRMFWGNTNYSFLRPIHWIMTLHGDKPYQIPVYDLQSNNVTYGHRFHAPGAITLKHVDDYEDKLQQAYVIACAKERKKSIQTQIELLATKQQAQAVVAKDLLDLVTGLVEWPHALIASFSEQFLEVPSEALITSMQNHQKCFAIKDTSGVLLPQFILISNIAPENPQMIIEGNERVMHARLADAQFFYEQDKKQTLASRLQRLKNMVFQKKLGTLYDKSIRITKLAQIIAAKTDANSLACEHAAKLCKADLLTDMVYEFPELQGIMGYYYALNDGESEDVAIAIKESYYPRFAKDILPSTLTGKVVALSDRLDTLVGIFGIGLTPTGDKDPYGLRRQAQGILRIIIENKWSLDLEELLKTAKHGYGNLLDQESLTLALNFCMERFKALYQEQGVSPQILESVLSTCDHQPYDCSLRVMAVSHFQTLKEAQSLAAANKRVRNLLQKSEFAFNLNQLPPINESLFQEPAEHALMTAIQHLAFETKPFIDAQDYQRALVMMASIHTVVNSFFDRVLIMTEDEAVRKNRLNLLTHLMALFSQIADISKLAL